MPGHARPGPRHDITGRHDPCIAKTGFFGNIGATLDYNYLMACQRKEICGANADDAPADDCYLLLYQFLT